MSYNNVFGFKTNNFHGLSLKQLLFRAKLAEETKIPEALEDITTSNLKKKINGFKLRKEFCDFSRKDTTLNEKEKCVCFIKYFVSNLYSHINKHGEIFETEELDRTKDHRRRLKEIIPNLNKIFEVELALKLSKKYANMYYVRQSAKEFFCQHNII